MSDAPRPPRFTPEPESDGLLEPERQGGFRPRFVLLALLVVGLGLGAWTYVAHGDAWMHDLDEGMAVATETGKPILVFYTANWCPPCRQLKATVLADPDVEAALAEKFVRVKIDLTNRTGPNAVIAAQYGVHAIPTMILYDERGNEQKRLTGGDLVGWLYAQASG